VLKVEERQRRLRILGVRGVPAAHGGFETFAERLALFLVGRGWKVTVYCQTDGSGTRYEDTWEGIRRINIPTPRTGAIGTVQFDWISTRHAAAAGEPCLTLGYNTAAFCTFLRSAGVPNVINMDGIEWQRAKWGILARVWLWLNERAGSWLGDHLIADHPEIKNHLQTRTSPRRITIIPYGADEVTDSDPAAIRDLGLEPGRYLSVIARPEPENSLLEIVSGFSQKTRGVQLVILGCYDRKNQYHRQVMDAASGEVRFLGAIYDKSIVSALRFHSMAYIHGHQVGGTNPSLVEALGAGNAIIAHDNRFNRWVAGPDAAYFRDARSLAEALDAVTESADRLAAMRSASRARHRSDFRWATVLEAYEALLAGFQGHWKEGTVGGPRSRGGQARVPGNTEHKDASYTHAKRNAKAG